MIIGGFQKFSLIDYPEKISCIIFTQGCNFKCPYCHNPELIGKSVSTITEESVLNFLKTRQGKLDGVVITGGEPTIQNDLLDFMKKIKELKFLIKLDTNGTNPNMLAYALRQKLVDYIAMDIKAPLEKYEDISNKKVCIDSIKESIKIIKNSGIAHEFRTTVVKKQLTLEDIKVIATIAFGSQLYIQKFVPSKHINESFKNESSYSDEELKLLKSNLSKNGLKFELRQ